METPQVAAKMTLPHQAVEQPALGTPPNAGFARLALHFAHESQAGSEDGVLMDKTIVAASTADSLSRST